MVSWKFMHIVASRQWRQETAMSINICIVWPSLRSSLVILSSFFILPFLGQKWQYQSKSQRTTDTFYSLFFFRILAMLALENVSVRKYCQNIDDWIQAKSDLLKTLLAHVLWRDHLHVDTAGIWPKALFSWILVHFSVCIIFLYYILKRRRWSDLFVKLNFIYLGPVTYSYIGNWSDPVRVFTAVSWFYFRKMYRLDPDKNRAFTRRTVLVRRFFWAPKANVKMMDKIFTILCWIFFLT